MFEITPEQKRIRDQQTIDDLDNLFDITPEQKRIRAWRRLLSDWADYLALEGIRLGWQQRLEQFAAGEYLGPVDRVIRGTLQRLRDEGSVADLPPEDEAAAAMLADRLQGEIEACVEAQGDRMVHLIAWAAMIWRDLAAIDPEMAAGDAGALESWVPRPELLWLLFEAWRMTKDDLGAFASILAGDEEAALARLGDLPQRRLREETERIDAVWQRFQRERLSIKARQIAEAASSANDPAPGGDREPPEPAAGDDDPSVSAVLAELPKDAVLILRVLAGGKQSRVQICEQARQIERGNVIGKNRVGELIRNELEPRGLVCLPSNSAVELTGLGAEVVRLWCERFDRESGRAIRRSGA